MWPEVSRQRSSGRSSWRRVGALAEAGSREAAASTAGVLISCNSLAKIVISHGGSCVVDVADELTVGHKNGRCSKCNIQGLIAHG